MTRDSDRSPLLGTPRLVILGRDCGAEEATWTFRGREVHVRTVDCGDGDPSRILRRIEDVRDDADVIALDGMPLRLELGPARRPHRRAAAMVEAAASVPVVDGSGVRSAVERWSAVLVRRLQPGLLSRRRVLMMPGLGHVGLAQSLERQGATVHYADPEIFFGLPDVPGVGSRRTLAAAAAPTLDLLENADWDRLFPSASHASRETGLAHRIRRVDVLAGDVATIRRFAGRQLGRKIVVVPSASEEDVEDLRTRGVEVVIELMPEIPGAGRLAAPILEGLFVATHRGPGPQPTDDDILDALAEMDWSPGIRRLSDPEEDVHRFAFVIHPLDLGFIHRHPQYRWTRHLPGPVVEATAAWMPPRYVATIRGGRSPATGQRIEGHLLALAATPRQMMQHSPRFTYDRLAAAARAAEQRGCRIMGLGAFTSVVGDAGATVAHEADIAITSGNSLTVAATLETAKIALRKMGRTDLSTGRAMVIGATGSIGAPCSRLIAQAVGDVVLVSIEPEKLIALKRTIQEETPGARVTIALRPGDLARDCDLVVTATSAFGQRILDLASCKPGAVVCDVARPPDIGPAEAALRPDVLVVESGEVLIPGDVDMGYDIGLPPGTAYACLAETALLAMEGRFESYTLGREIEPARVREIYRLFQKHRFEIAPLRSFGVELDDDEFARRREAAEQLSADPARLEKLRSEVRDRLRDMPIVAKGVARSEAGSILPWLAAGAAGMGLLWLLAKSEEG